VIAGGEKIILRNVLVSSDEGHAVFLTNGSTFVMEAGFILNGGTNANGIGIFNGSKYIVNGGEIYGNTLRGVLIRGANSHFGKTGGIIWGNAKGDKSNTDSAIEAWTPPNVDPIITLALNRGDTVIWNIKHNSRQYWKRHCF